MGELFRRIRYLIHHRRYDAELESDMEFHREMAARQGSNNFGNTLHLRELAHDAWGWAWLDHLMQDMRWAVRGIKRAPGSAAAMIVLLALGMGGVTALFGPLYSLVLRPLPFPHSDRLVRINDGQLLLNHQLALYSIFSDVTDYQPDQSTLSSGGPAVNVGIAKVTPEFFPTLGVQPRLGHGFPIDAKIDEGLFGENSPGVIVSDQVWRTRLQGQSNLSKCSITLSQNRYTVLGVMPPEFDFPAETQVWMVGNPAGNRDSFMVARLRPGMSMGHAEAGVKRLAPAGTVPTLESLHNVLLGDRRPLLWILSAVSALFLALACAGVTNLMLARGIRRRPEMVVRAVLGAGRARLIRQLLTETLLLTAAGGLLGMAISAVAGRGLRLLLPELLEGSATFTPATIALVVVLTLAVTLLCGVAPAFHATGADLNSSLKAGNSGLSTGNRRRGFTSHELFAGGQLILAMILLVSTGLLLRSMVARLNFPLGFEPQNVAVIRVNLPPPAESQALLKSYMQQYPLYPRSKNKEVQLKFLKPMEDIEVARNDLYYRGAIKQLSGIPGVISVAFMENPPFAKASFDSNGAIFPEPFGKPVFPFITRNVSADAFRVLGIPILAGRTFLPEDIPSSDAWDSFFWVQDLPAPSTTAIVNATFARRIWPNQNPLGKMLMDGHGQHLKVVGVAADIHESRSNLDIIPTVYEPFQAAKRNIFGDYVFIVKLRPGVPLAPFAAAVKSNLPPLPQDAAPVTVLPLQESQGNLPMALTLLSCFSVLGIVVAGLGVYATATLMAAARTRETGIRLAIGASAEQIGRLVLWRSVRLALLALPLGAFGAWALGLSLKHWLFQVGAADPVSYLTSMGILLVIALAAGLWPAIQAATTDPSTALRYDG